MVVVSAMIVKLDLLALSAIPPTLGRNAALNVIQSSHVQAKDDAQEKDFASAFLTFLQMTVHSVHQIISAQIV